MIHYCPNCGLLSQHGTGAAHFALTCPACCHTAPWRREPVQTPLMAPEPAHTPDSDARTVVLVTGDLVAFTDDRVAGEGDES